MFEIILHLGIIIFLFYFLTKIVDEYFLASLENIAEWLRMPPSIAGATLLAMGTSAPELGTAIFALLLPDPNPAIGAGTIVGSAIFQLLVVVGFTALVAGGAKLNWRLVIRDTLTYLAAVALLIWVISDGLITFEEATYLVIAYLIYLGMLFATRGLFPEPDALEQLEEDIHELQREKKGIMTTVANIFFLPISWGLRWMPDVNKKPNFTLFVFVMSLVLIGISSYFTVNSAQVVAEAFGIPTSIIALTILAGGTSVPELISSAIISAKGKADMAIANAIGSNTFDVLVSLGLPVLIFTYATQSSASVPDQNVASSLILLMFITVGVLALLIARKFKIDRFTGIVLILVYIGYVLATVTGTI